MKSICLLLLLVSVALAAEKSNLRMEVKYTEDPEYVPRF